MRLYIYAAFEDTPSYPDGITGTDADKTMTTAGIRDSGLAIARIVKTGTTNDQVYPFRGFSLRSVLDGALPTDWGLFYAHDTGPDLNNGSANHKFWYTPQYPTF